MPLKNVLKSARKTAVANATKAATRKFNRDSQNLRHKACDDGSIAQFRTKASRDPKTNGLPDCYNKKTGRKTTTNTTTTKKQTKKTCKC